MPEHWYTVPSVALSCWFRPKSHQKPILAYIGNSWVQLGSWDWSSSCANSCFGDSASPNPTSLLEGRFSGRDVSCSTASGLSAVEWSQFWSVHSSSHGAHPAVMRTLLDTSLWLSLGEGFYLFINFPLEKCLGTSQYISSVKSSVSCSWFAQTYSNSIWRPAMIFFHLISCMWISPATRQCLSAHVPAPVAQWLLLACTRCPVILRQCWLHVCPQLRDTPTVDWQVGLFRLFPHSPHTHSVLSRHRALGSVLLLWNECSHIHAVLVHSDHR